MATAMRLEQYLQENGAPYDEMAHQPTMSSLRSAEACHVSGDCLAKGVVLRDSGEYVLAVLPASHHLDMAEIERRLNRRLDLASEDEIEELFPDCDRGAVPPIGAAYGLRTIVDDSITEEPEVYFEGGDHETLVHMNGATFANLMRDASHGRISTHD